MEPRYLNKTVCLQNVADDGEHTKNSTTMWVFNVCFVC